MYSMSLGECVKSTLPLTGKVENSMEFSLLTKYLEVHIKSASAVLTTMQYWLIL